MATPGPDFDDVYARLKGILEPYAPEMYVSADDEKAYSLDLAPPEARNPTTWFGGVMRWKHYVSFYLMPVYVDPGLVDAAYERTAGAPEGRAATRVERGMAQRKAGERFEVGTPG